jgi:hypothetical protein
VNKLELSIVFRIISRREWNRLHGWHRACPGSRIEHLMHGLYVLHVPAGAGIGEGGAA